VILPGIFLFVTFDDDSSENMKCFAKHIFNWPLDQNYIKS
jgi:hypothetical protein